MTLKMSSKGQIVIPKQVRENLRLKEGDRLELILQDDQLVIRKEKRRGREEVNWRSWRGILAGTKAVQEHLAEHQEEIRR